MADGTPRIVEGRFVPIEQTVSDALNALGIKAEEIGRKSSLS
jgi:hypothetical protein